MLDAISTAMTRLRSAKHKRRALLIISDGGDNSSHHKYREIKSLVRDSDVEVYAIGLFDTAFFKTYEEFMGKKWLSEITDATGGRTVTVDSVSKMGEAAAAISTEMRSQYVLGYRPSNVLTDGKETTDQSASNQPVHARRATASLLQERLRNPEGVISFPFLPSLCSLTESFSAPQYKLFENGIGLGLAAASQSILQAGLTGSF